MISSKNYIVCYGDSNTYGFCPTEPDLRFPESRRWTTILNAKLGSDYHVIPEGLNGRTTAYDWPEGYQDPLGGDKNGLHTLQERLSQYPETDVEIIMLGTNDCSCPMQLSAEEIAAGIEKLVFKSREVLLKSQGFAPQIIIVAPAAICPETEGTLFEDYIDATSAKKSNDIVPLFKEIAKKNGCLFLDASMCEVNTLDCEHLTAEGHVQLAELLFPVICEMSGK